VCETIAKIRLLVCEYIAEETGRLLQELEAGDIEMGTYEAECARRKMSINSVIHSFAGPEEKVSIIGAQCLNEMGALPRSCRKALNVRTDQCFDLFCGREALDGYVASGAFIIVPGWLRRWRRNMHDWAVEKHVARDIFRSSTSRIVLLVTAPYEGMEDDLREFSEFAGVPSETVVVGLRQYRELLRDAIHEARLNHEFSETRRRLAATEMTRANLALALDSLREISNLIDEGEIIKATTELFIILFSPREISYRQHRTPEGAAGAESANCDEESGAGLAATKVGKGFVVPIVAREGVVGTIEVGEVAFPGYIDKYMPLASDICTVVGLSITKARAFHALAESKAMTEERLRIERAAGELSRLLATRDLTDNNYDVEARILGEVAQADRVEILLPSVGPSLLTAGSWSTGVQAAPTHTSVPDGGQDLLESLEMLVISSAGKGASQGAIMAANVQLQGRAQGLIVLSSADTFKKWKEGIDNLVTIFARMLASILERERMNRELLLLNDSLHVANKIMRHDVRNELHVASGALELYRMRPEGRFLDMATASLDKIGRMLDQMKEMDAFLRIGAGLKPFSLHEVAEVAMAGNSLPVDVTGDAEVLADHAIYSVLDNLVRNAKVHGGGENVRIAIRQAAEVTLRVEDNGRGIPEEAMPHIFEEGYSQGPTQGTGLGLFIVKRTMERYGGRVHAEANQPKGAVMVLTFPRTPQ
jgi:signal transduction histidine kinase